MLCCVVVKCCFGVDVEVVMWDVMLLCYCCGLKLGGVVHGGQDYIKYKNFENVLDKFYFKV